MWFGQSAFVQHCAQLPEQSFCAAGHAHPASERSYVALHAKSHAPASEQSAAPFAGGAHAVPQPEEHPASGTFAAACTQSVPHRLNPSAHAEHPGPAWPVGHVVEPPSVAGEDESSAEASSPVDGSLASLVSRATSPPVAHAPGPRASGAQIASAAPHAPNVGHAPPLSIPSTERK